MFRIRSLSLAALLLAAPALAAPPAPAPAKQTAPLTVTARLVKIPGKLPPDELYDYAFVMKYQVVGGKLDKQVLLVAHYKPLRPRAKIDDKMKKVVSGDVKSFKEGDLHQLVLTPELRKHWKGAVVDELFATDRKSQRYFCLRADLAKAR